MLTLPTVLFTCWLSSCGGYVSKEALFGSYRLSSAGGVIRLDLHAGGLFVETIYPSNAPVISLKGRWEAPTKSSPQLGLHGLWIPLAFLPDYIRTADEMSGNGVKYSSKGYWVGIPIYEFGNVVIPLFPDSDVRFERFSPSGAP